MKVYSWAADVCHEAVQVIQSVIQLLGSEITTTILNAISPLFVSVDRDMRLCLCDLLETLAQVDPSVDVVVNACSFLYVDFLVFLLLLFF